jgi:hypothetical protein
MIRDKKMAFRYTQNGQGPFKHWEGDVTRSK